MLAQAKASRPPPATEPATLVGDWAGETGWDHGSSGHRIRFRLMIRRAGGGRLTGSYMVMEEADVWFEPDPAHPGQHMRKEKSTPHDGRRQLLSPIENTG